MKSKAKAAGLKSTFRFDQELYMTSFGKGNAAIPEKRVTADQEIVSLNTDKKTALSVESRDVQFDILGRRELAAQVDNPLYLEEGPDIGLRMVRNQLENRFFDKTFTDNLHIQIIHNILDIEKILAVHVNNCVFVLDNLLRDKDNFSTSDPIGNGSLTTRNLYSEIMADNADYKRIKSRNAFQLYVGDADVKARLGYFGELFYCPKPDAKKDTDYWMKPYRDVYNILSLVGDLRQCINHDEESEHEEGTKWGRSGIYNLDTMLNPEVKATLDALYLNKFNQVVREFGKFNGANNFDILFKVFDPLWKTDTEDTGELHIPNRVKTGLSDDEKKKLIKSFYRFNVLEKHKELGFSVKLLREALFKKCPEAAAAADDKYSTVRGKLYMMINFIIYEAYSGRYKEYESPLVYNLRAALSDAQKNRMYEEEAVRLWNEIPVVNGQPDESRSIRVRVLRLLDILSHPDSLSKEKSGKDARVIVYSSESASAINMRLVNSALESMTLHETESYFVKLIFMLTYLLDGKEINDLLTTLISKFDNIVSLERALADYEGVKAKEYDKFKLGFRKEYTFFEFCNVRKLAVDIRLINRIARMSHPINKASEIMFVEAADLLGYKQDRETLVKVLKLADKKDAKGKHDFRNFIGNNVIESYRFHYLIRYGDPKRLRTLSQNREVVGFVLKKIPEKQINRYYETCFGKTSAKPEERIDKLTDLIRGLTLDDFRNVQSKQDAVKDPLCDKAKKIASVTLYITVLYLLLKNLVNINARYTMAFHCLERDYSLKTGKGLNYGKKDVRYLTREALAVREANVAREKEACEKRIAAVKADPTKKMHQRYYDKYNRLKHQADVLRADFGKADDDLTKQFRNKCCHLNHLREIDTAQLDGVRFNSYYELYHYIVQDYMLREYEAGGNGKPSDGSLELLRMAREKKQYGQDLVKILCICFGYNYPRFKNLTINVLFDRNADPSILVGAQTTFRVRDPKDFPHGEINFAGKKYAAVVEKDCVGYDELSKCRKDYHTRVVVVGASSRLVNDSPVWTVTVKPIGQLYVKN